MKYKFAPKYRERLVPYLQELTQQQIEKGLIRYVWTLTIVDDVCVEMKISGRMILLESRTFVTSSQLIRFQILSHL